MLAVTYVTASGDTIGTYNPERIYNEGGRPQLELLKASRANHRPGRPTWDREMHQVYRVSSSADANQGAGRQSPTLVLGCSGAIHPDLATAVVVLVGTIPANGTISVQVPVPSPLAVQGAPLFWQLALTDPVAGCVVGAPSAMLLLDARF